jgi:hypothetical protein
MTTITHTPDGPRFDGMTVGELIASLEKGASSMSEVTAAALRHLSKQLAGQPISTAPRDGTEILCVEDGVFRVCRPKAFNLDRWEYFRNEQFCPGHTFSLSPSHWWRLPRVQPGPGAAP